MEVINPVVIEKGASQDPALDFALLRQEGIELLQKLSGKTWTDFNLHDPGVTILEQLCFAITDLAYRSDFPIEDILTNAKGYIERRNNSFFTKEQILTTNPITVNDFRKVILDEVSELTNVLMEPVTSRYSSGYIKGLYQLKIQVNKETAGRLELEAGLEEDLKTKVKRCFLNRRNICEDMVSEVVLLKPQKICVFSEVIINEQFLPEEILAKIYHTVELLLAPPVKRYSEKELYARGYKTEEVFSGPLLKNGFIPDSELKPMNKELDPFAVTEAISKVPGVIYVKNLFINEKDANGVNKPFKLKPNHFPLLETESGERGIKLFTNAYEIEINTNAFKRQLTKFQEATATNLKAPVAEPEKEIRKGHYRHIQQYSSIQESFPITYGIGQHGLSEREPAERKAQAKQLKAYLLFFEQMFANYLAQLEGASSFFSSDIENAKTAQNTYYYQPLYDIHGIRDILRPFNERISLENEGWQDFISDDTNSYIQSLKTSQETTAQYRKRKHLVLDHLLARFNEQYSPYPVMLFNTVYSHQNAVEPRVDNLLKWKAEMLRNIPGMNHDRVKAFNYLQVIKNTTGFEKKMSALLFLKNRTNRNLTRDFDTDKLTMWEREKRITLELSESPDEVDWDEEEQKVLSRDNSIKQVHILERADKNENYVFKNETTDILKHGINPENYRIGRSDGNTTFFQIIYRQPPAQYWKVISLHPTKAEATMALDKLIAFLKNLSIESEGFHLLEHILLRPLISGASFGYRFCTEYNKVLFQNVSWTDFKNRERHLRRILRTIPVNGEAPSIALPEAKLAQVKIKINRPGFRKSVSLAELCLARQKENHFTEDSYEDLKRDFRKLWQVKQGLVKKELAVVSRDLNRLKKKSFNAGNKKGFYAWWLRVTASAVTKAQAMSDFFRSKETSARQKNQLTASFREMWFKNRHDETIRLLKIIARLRAIKLAELVKKYREELRQYRAYRSPLMAKELKSTIERLRHVRNRVVRDELQYQFRKLWYTKSGWFRNNKLQRVIMQLKKMENKTLAQRLRRKYHDLWLKRNDVPVEEINELIEGMKQIKRGVVRKELERSIGDFRTNRTELYPAIEMLVKLKNNLIINENFFNSQLTVVFPTWPARFQVEDFRNFVEDLFVVNAPTHIRFNFIWLGITEMKEFERTYFEWLESMKAGGLQATRDDLAVALIKFITRTDAPV